MRISYRRGKIFVKTMEIFAYNADPRLRDPNPLRCEYQASSECPVCHFPLAAIILEAYFVRHIGSPDGDYDLNLLEFCPHCHHVILETFHSVESYPTDPCTQFGQAYSSVPGSIKAEKFPKAVVELSPSFVEIYTQASHAESQKLDQICGVGYRKALEYLTKDYLCSTHSDDSETIKKEPLSAAIRRIENPRIKVLAERSAWIGNDETHYVRKHIDVDVADMKRFIHALCFFIDSDLAFRAAETIE